MYDYEEGMTQCQNEIRRLRSVVRQEEEEIARLRILLYNAIEYISETTGGNCKWYEETLGITAEELTELGFRFVD